MDQPETTPHPHRGAGAFGFSRRETRGVVALALTVAVVAGIQSWAGRPAPVGAPVKVADLRIAPAPAPAVDSAGFDSDARRALAVEWDHRTDVNSASRYALMRLPGIGDVLADRIIASREKDGPFRSLQDLERVFGIGPKKAAMLGGWVQFGPVNEQVSTGETEP